MLRSSLFTASAFAFMASAAAQTNAPLQTSYQRITGPVKYAGTYDVETKTWVRGQSAAANFGQPDNIYSNTAPSGFFAPTVSAVGPAPGGTVIDAGQIPSSSNPGLFTLGGLRDSSEVTGVQIGYCDLDITGAVAGWSLDFYNNYGTCSGDPDPAQLAFNITATGLPANGCWIIDFTLPAGTILSHDGEGLYDGVDTLDTFGIAHTYIGTGIDAAGLLISGDPVNTDTGYVIGNAPQSGSNTYYGEIGGCPGFGSGYGNGDNYQVNDPLVPATSGCYFFNGYNNTGSPCGGPLAGPFGSWYTEISGQEAGPVGPISTPGCTGNVNITGVPGEIEVAAGSSAIAADNNAVLRAFNLPASQFGIFATGLAPIAPGTINSGNGTLCINPGAQGGLGRFSAANQIKNTGTTGEITLDTNAGEWDLALIPTSVGTYAAAAGITSYFQGWHRELVGAGYNFTGSCSIVWQ